MSKLIKYLDSLLEMFEDKTITEETYHGDSFFEKYGWIAINETLVEAEYQGRKVELNKPHRTSGGPKKFSVYTKNAKGNVVKVNFGDPNMTIKKRFPKHRKSYRARHHCDTNPGPKWKANYWSCRNW